MRRVIYGLAIVCACSWAFSAAAQEESSEPPTDARAKFDELFVQWKALLAELRELRLEYQIAKPEERPPLVERFDAVLEETDAFRPELTDAAVACYEQEEKADSDVGKFLFSAAASEISTDNYPEVYRLAKLLSDRDYPDKSTLAWTAISAFAMANYDEAEQYLKKAEEAGAVPNGLTLSQSELDRYRELWAKEQAIREAEAEADDLPRVRLQTSQGDMVIELFENEAPNTVANFIDLVEQNFYDGLTFHRVLHGFMAQGGCPKGDGTGGPGYAIPCEVDEEDHRLHFTGSLSMAHAGRDTGGSQFFITFLPTAHLDGKHTVFGRVIEGLDVLADIKQHDPSAASKTSQPDRIIKAEVLRKRPHEYEVNKLPDPR